MQGVVRAPAVEPVDSADLPEVLELLEQDPVSDVFVASRVRQSGIDGGRLGGTLWGYREDGKLVSLCFSGANLVPVAATKAAVRTFSDLAVRRGRECTSIVGPAEPVLAMWDRLRPSWGPAREVRGNQPVLAIDHMPLVEPDPEVRRVRPEELDVLMPAAVAMFTEEVGVSPVGRGNGGVYRARLAELVRAGRSFARFEGDRIVFKAEITAVTPQACQIQGVWVHPDARGRGLAAPGVAAVVQHALDHVAPVVTLYVNDFNHVARAVYRRVGFGDAGTFATVLF